MFQLKAESIRACQSVKDPERYRPKVVRNVEKFNQAIEHFRQNGQNWPRSKVFGSMITEIPRMQSYEDFERWILRTQKQYMQLEVLPGET